MQSCRSSHPPTGERALDTQNHQGVTALMLACNGNHEQCARALIEAGARKDLETKKGSTALSLARSNGHSALCALLENSGID